MGHILCQSEIKVCKAAEHPKGFCTVAVFSTSLNQAPWPVKNCWLQGDDLKQWQPHRGELLPFYTKHFANYSSTHQAQLHPVSSAKLQLSPHSFSHNQGQEAEEDAAETKSCLQVKQQQITLVAKGTLPASLKHFSFEWICIFQETTLPCHKASLQLKPFPHTVSEAANRLDILHQLPTPTCAQLISADCSTSWLVHPRTTAELQQATL